MPPTTQIHNQYKNLLSIIEDQALAVFYRLWEGYDLNDYNNTRYMLENDIPLIVASYGQSSAEIAAELYEAIRAGIYKEGYYADLAEFNEEALLGSIRYLYQQNDDDYLRLETLIGRYLQNSARNTIINNALRDQRENKKLAGWARVPGAENPCRFCVMLASRGFVYKTEQTASVIQGGTEPFHDHCRCIVVPGFGDKPSWPGYDEEHYYRLYLADRAAGYWG